MRRFKSEFVDAIAYPKIRLAAWSITAFATVAVAWMLRLYGCRLAMAGFAACAAITFVLLALHLVYLLVRRDAIVSAATGAIALLAWSGVMGATIGLLGLKSGAPLIDHALAEADAALGLDTQQIVAWVAHHPPAGALLGIAYVSSIPLIFGAVVVLALTRRERRLWELCFCFAGTVTACALISTFAPAVGAVSFLHTSGSVLDLLPPGAGTYYVPEFEAYRSGGLDVIDFGHLQGVVQFPSFHRCMALMTGYALRGIRGLSAINYVWNGVVVVSTIPIGGHYAIDLLAGACLWLVFIMIAQRLGSGEESTPAAARRMLPRACA